MREIVEYADAMGVNVQDAEQAQRDAISVEETPAMRVSINRDYCRLEQLLSPHGAVMCTESVTAAAVVLS